MKRLLLLCAALAALTPIAAFSQNITFLSYKVTLTYPAVDLSITEEMEHEIHPGVREGGAVVQLAAQQVKKIEFDTDIIVGKWMATDGDKSFELQIVKDTLFFPIDKTFFESLDGAIIYKQNGKIIRTTHIDGYNSLISAIILSPSEIDILFNDEERKIIGTGLMTIDPINPNKASWKLQKNERRMLHSDWNVVDFDIPTELEWTKIE